MAFDSSPGGPAHGPSPTKGTRMPSPEVERPSGAAWSALEADGIRWEGQVLVVGAGTEIPARLILTTRQFVLVNGGEVILDVPRTWLRPGAQLVDDSDIRVFMTPDGAKAGSDETDRLLIRAGAGRRSAAQLVSTLTGRIVSPRTHARQPDTHGAGGRPPNDVPTWGDRIGAAMPMALPPLPDFDDEPVSKQPWPPIEQQAIPAPQPKPQSARAKLPTSRGASGTAPEIVADRTVTGGAIEGVSGAATATWANRPTADGSTGTPAAAPAARTRVGRSPSRAPAVTNDDARAYVAVEHHQFNRGLVWSLRLVILFMLLGTGFYFGRDRLYERLDLTFPANVEERLGLDRDSDDVSQLPAGSEGAGSQGSDGSGDGTQGGVPSDGTNGAPNGGAISPDQEQGAAGSGSRQTATEAPAAPTAAPPSDASSTGDGDAASDGSDGTDVEPTGVSVEPAQEPEVVAATEIPTEVALAEPTEIPTELPTEISTEAPTEVPTETPTQAPTEAPTETPTDVPAETPTDVSTETPTATATTTPTEVPAETPTTTPTEVPAETPTATAAPTEAPAEEPTEPALESQPPSVDPGTPPAQSLADGSFRYAIEGAAIGDTIPELPEVNDVGAYGEWVVLSLYGENWTDAEQVFDMSQFRLYADGEEILLDVGNSWVSSQLGFSPAYGNTDAILWAPDEGHRFALTFLVPPDAETLVLQAGDQVIDLEPVLEQSAPLTVQGDGAELPEYIDATVTEVVDGETIVIESQDQEGVEQPVRYLGIDAPTDDDCFAEESTAANARLVEGRKVRIERQATDVDAQGNWVRDVWVEAEDGRFFLVAEALVSEGAAKAGISEPNTRFASWLMGSESAAQAAGEGLWGACESEGIAVPDGTQAVLDPAIRVTAFRRSDR